MLPTCESSTYMAFTERNAALHRVNQQVNNMRDRRQHRKKRDRPFYVFRLTWAFTQSWTSMYSRMLLNDLPPLPPIRKPSAKNYIVNRQEDFLPGQLGDSEESQIRPKTTERRTNIGAVRKSSDEDSLSSSTGNWIDWYLFEYENFYSLTFQMEDLKRNLLCVVVARKPEQKVKMKKLVLIVSYKRM